MKKKSGIKPSPKKKDGLSPEYDFREGVRGKHFKAFRKGHTVTVLNGDGSERVQRFTLADGALRLETDEMRHSDCPPGR